MSRWHSSSCLTPSIVVRNGPGQEGIPHCQACGKSPNLEEIAQAQSANGGSSAQEPPPDAEIGQMRLWWPRSVPYTDNLEADTEASGSDTVLAADTISAPPAHDDYQGLNPVYLSELETGSFRLACLSSVESHVVPVHVNLETYHLNNCPAYEAVSYTWGGENADSSRSRPVYVGSYWDVTMQTENCWEMLRFVRPRKRGVRLVWVDALCINQSNTAERSTQVSNMARIFSEAMQAIVYLGPDIATQLPVGEYARRRRLHELDLGRGHDSSQDTQEPSHDTQRIAKMNIRRLLERRYFSRLWVVQELLLSARAVIRIGDVDFWTDGVSSALWPEGERNEKSATKKKSRKYGQQQKSFLRKTAAPWMTHISSGFLSDRAGQILPQIMMLTASTDCSDTRDHVFGVLGLLKQDENEPALQADYSLSLQHVYIGLFAHLLLHDNLWGLLVHCMFSPADDANNSLHRPSWVPDWRSKIALRTFWASVAVSPWSAQPEDDSWLRSLMFDHKAKVNRLSGILTPDRYYFSVGYMVKVFDQEKAQPPSNLKIERQTGAIRGDMVRLMTISSQPVPVGSRQNGSIHIFQVLQHGRPVLLYSRYRLDRLVQISNDDIYLVDQFHTGDWPGYLILRRLSPRLSPSAHKKRRFIACCELVLFEFDRLHVPEKHNHTTRWSLKRSVHVDNGLRVALTRGPFAWTLPMVLRRAQAFSKLFQSNMRSSTVRSLVFLGVNQPRQALEVYKALLDKMLPSISHSSARDFKNAYYSCFDPSLCPAAGKTYFGLALPTSDLWDVYARYHLAKAKKGRMRWRACTVDKLPDRIRDDLQHEIAWAQPESGSKWRVTFRLSDVQKYILSSAEMELVYLLRQVSKKTGISEEELFERDPNDMDSRVLVPVCPWSEVLVDKLGCDTALDEIRIV